jgi:hypothetical protein
VIAAGGRSLPQDCRPAATPEAVNLARALAHGAFRIEPTLTRSISRSLRFMESNTF